MKTEDEEALYPVLSVNANAMAWKGPLWDAINDYARTCGGKPDRHVVFIGGSRAQAVDRVEAAVETAIRIAYRAGATRTDDPAQAPVPPLPTQEGGQDGPRGAQQQVS